MRGSAGEPPGGTYTVTYEATTPGDYVFSVTYEGAFIRDMPKTVFIAASAAASKSYAEGPGLEQPSTYHLQQFTIHAVDHDGAPRTSGGDVFQVAINGPEMLTPAVTDNNDGTYTVTYEATTPGDYVFSVTYEGAFIRDMPKTVFIAAS